MNKRRRFDILRRDGFRCRYCGATPTESHLHVDHIKPLAEGGTDDPDNLVCACDSCNLGKKAMHVSRSEVVPRLDWRSLADLEMVAQYEHRLMADSEGYQMLVQAAYYGGHNA